MRVEIPKTNERAGRVFDIHNEKDFHFIALEVFEFQFSHNPLYGDYCRALKRTPGGVRRVEDIPFLPISFFKNHRIATTAFDPELVFRSSGTGGMSTSTHYVRDASLYEQSFSQAFSLFYGDARDYCILGLLPSYLERGQSSLVYMVNQLIQQSGHPKNGFYLNEFDRLSRTLGELEEAGQPTLLIGVTYALIDFAAQYPQQLNYTTVMETGGMKGRRRELTRPELYAELCPALGVKEIHSEYGMTELLSQAYAINGKFRTPPWMRVYLRDETDPFDLPPQSAGLTGAINVVDLTNLYSCSFIATEDVGRWTEDEHFEVLGRLDHTDIRGCSLLSV